ncbi:hypothetical protein INT82_01505 [Mannheimia haemolytica]|nr:hypothetical protein [Mannheimia haemolytica]
MSVESKVDYDDLQDMVASNDSGGRTPSGLAKKPLCMSPFSSVFQIYYAFSIAVCIPRMAYSRRH